MMGAVSRGGRYDPVLRQSRDAVARHAVSCRPTRSASARRRSARHHPRVAFMTGGCCGRTSPSIRHPPAATGSPRGNGSRSLVTSLRNWKTTCATRWTSPAGSRSRTGQASSRRRHWNRATGRPVSRPNPFARPPEAAPRISLSLTDDKVDDLVVTAYQHVGLNCLQ